MVAEAAHGLGLAGDAELALGVEALGLDKGEGDLAVQFGVMGEIDPFLAALAQQALHLIASIAERSRLPSRREPPLDGRLSFFPRASFPSKCSLGGREESLSI